MVRKLVGDRKAEEAREAAASAAAASSSDAAQPASIAGTRATKARKARTQNLLNHEPLPPTTAAEIELMLKSVAEAESRKPGKRRKGARVWDVAADLYRQAFMSNCAADESARIMIRAPTTAEFIKSKYEAMAAQHRSRAAEADAANEATSEQPAAPEQPAVPPPPPPPSLPPQPPQPPPPSAAKCEERPSAAKCVQSVNKREVWKQRINEGRAITEAEVGTLGCMPLCAYLRAMGVSVDRNAQKDAPELRRLMGAELARRGVNSWCVTDVLGRGKRHKSS